MIEAKDLATTEGMLALLDHMRDVARKNFIEDGHLTPVQFVIATVAPDKRIQPLEEPALVPVATVGRVSRDQLAGVLKQACRATKAIGVIMIHESWWVGASPEDAAQAMKWFEEHGTLAEYPNRKEVIFCGAEHRTFMSGKAWIAQITRDKDNKPSLGEFSELLGKNEGLMNGFLEYLA